MKYTNAQIAKAIKNIIENAEILDNALDVALRATEIEEQNKRYREVVEEAIKDLENECLWDALIKLKALEVEK